MQGMKKTDRGMAGIVRLFGMVLAISAFWNMPCSGQQPGRPLVVGWAQLDGSKLEGSYLHATVLLPQQLMRSLYFRHGEVSIKAGNPGRAGKRTGCRRRKRRALPWRSQETAGFHSPFCP
jgi:hypothetical protein